MQMVHQRSLYLQEEADDHVIDDHLYCFIWEKFLSFLLLLFYYASPFLRLFHGCLSQLMSCIPILVRK